jgi:Flavodoxin reductases (ferredoxin-NADPH reductases) family 1
VRSRAATWLTGTVRQARPLTESSRSIIFTVPGWPGSEAGQHVDIRLTAPDGYQAVRSYSIASASGGEQVELAIARIPEGEVSPFLVDDIEIGDAVELRGPLGGWFVWRPAESGPVQLIAGGSGVVPFLAMIRANVTSGGKAPMRLLYSLRAPEDALYRDELSQPSANVSVNWHYTRAAPPGWSRTPARLSADDLRERTFAPEDVSRTYVCGPTGFVEAVARALISIGHDTESIRTERFGGTT